MNKINIVAMAMVSLSEAINITSEALDFDDDYFYSTTYKRQEPEAKLADLWSVLVPDESDTSVAPQDLYFNYFPDLMTQDMTLSFTDLYDQLDDSRHKAVHT